MSSYNLKKLLIITLFILILFFIFFKTVISNYSQEQSDVNNKFKVITTFTIIADIAKNIAGNYATVESLTKPDAELHSYSPTPKDIKKCQGAQLILWNGLDLESWFKKFFNNFKNVPSVVVTEGITPISIVEGPYNGKPNPHAWMSSKNALIYIDNIKKAFIKYDTKHAKYYEQNAIKYKNKIIKAMAPIEIKLKSIPDENKWLVTSEGAFSYLVRDFNLKELYLWPINSDNEGTPKQIKKVIDIINKNHVIAIFSEQGNVSDKPAKQIAKETGIKYGGLLYVDSLSNATGKVPTYIDLLKVTLSTIANVLTQEPNVGKKTNDKQQ